MPARPTEVVNHMELLIEDICSQSLIDVDTLRPNTEPLVSDDVWKKFELDFLELPVVDDDIEYINTLTEGWSQFSSRYRHRRRRLQLETASEIRNHDCMWAGHCGSKEHPTDEPRAVPPISFFVPSKAPVVWKTPAPVKQQNNQPVSCRQSLLKPAVRAAAAAGVLATVHTPQTPPMSDDEEVRMKPTKILQLLNQAISECDLEDDNDLYEYFEEDDDADVNVTDLDARAVPDGVIAKNQYAAENDHSYHKDKNASMRIESLGIDTPSDSEEEIDVVSVGDKFSTNKAVCSLPTNPSTKDRQKIQRRMATAISRKRSSNGIKTILPTRRPPSADDSRPERRGIKRSRQSKIAPMTMSYKRKMYGPGSDSEHEPSEKRSLHNNMERQRRIDLRNAFEDLRLLVPEVSKKERAAKVVILREAAQYCDFLGNVSQTYIRQKEELRRHQERLRARVSQLRRNLAAKR